MKHKISSPLFLIFILLLLTAGFSAQAFTVCPTASPKGVGCPSEPSQKYYCGGECRDMSSTYCPQNSLESASVPNCNKLDVCGVCNACVGGYTYCGPYLSPSACKQNTTTPDHCTAYDQCSQLCSACVNGYVLTGGVCGGVSLKLSGDSVGPSNYLFQSSNPVLTILPGGNVGIGTVTPGAKLDISGTTQISSDGVFKWGSAANLGFLSWDSYALMGAQDGDLGIRTNQFGSDRITIKNSTGNVGIGTTAPGYKLSVVDTGATPMVNIWNNSGTSQWIGERLARGGTGDGTEKWFIGMNSADDKLRFRRTAGTDDMVIDASGNVGIGTVNPSYKLDVQGAGIAGQINAAAGLCIAGDCKTAWNQVVSPPGTNLWTASGNNIYNSNSGNVGIGTTNPGGKLDIQLAAANYRSYNYGMDLVVNTVGGWARSNRIYNEYPGTTVKSILGAYGSATNMGYAYWSVGDPTPDGGTGYTLTTGVFLTPSGNFGIGATGPSEKLQVNGNIKLGPAPGEGDVKDVNAIIGYNDLFLRSNSAESAPVYLAGNQISAFTGGIERLRINSAGNVGIGTVNPGALLEVGANFSGYSAIFGGGSSGSVRWGNGAQGGLSWDTGKAMVYGLSGNDLSLGSNGTYDQLYIKTGGNVGIGTINPGYRLDVHGDIRSDGTFRGGNYRSDYASVGSDINAYNIQAINSRASGYSVIAGKNPGVSFSVLMIHWDGANTLESNCNNQINPGWHPQAAIKGNYFSQIFDGSDFTGYSTVITSQSEFDSYKSSGSQWWIACSTLTSFSQNAATNYWTLSGNNLFPNSMDYNVGIGTMAPNGSLHVFKSSGNNAEFDIQSVAGPGNHWGVYNDRATNDLRFWNNTVPGDKNALTIKSNGNVGIGTASPNSKLEVNGSEIKITSTGGAPSWQTRLLLSSDDYRGEGIWLASNAGGTYNPWFVGRPYASTGFTIGYSATQPEYVTNSKLYIDTAGKVGIGTIGPTAALQINPPSSTEGLRIVTASNWSPLNIRNTIDTVDIFRVDQSGILQVGNVPWSRLSGFPAACGPGQFVTAVGATLTCASVAVGGGGDITDVLPGTGITVTNPTGPQPSVSVKNNSFSCGAVNQGLKTINIDTGAVICETYTPGGASQWTTSGSNIYYNSGKVGIGNIAPASLLQVGMAYTAAATYKGDVIIARDGITGSASAGGLEFLNDNYGGGYGWKITPVDPDSNAQKPLIFSTRLNSATWTDLMAIQHNGYVGLGTIAPNSSLHIYKNLDSNAEFDIQSVAGPGNHWGVYNDRATNDLRFWNNTVPGDKNALTIKSNGNVGIGTTDPTSKLQVTGGIAITGTSYFRGNGIDFLNVDASGDVNFWTGGTKTIFNNGNVGIGTTSPGNIAANGFTLNTSSKVLQIDSASSYGYPSLYMRSGSASAFAGLDITVDPVTTGTVYLDSRYGAGGTVLGGFQFRTKTAGTLVNAMSISYDGNVGIGLTGPGYRLDVAGGDINTSGVFRKGGTAGVSATCAAGNTPSGITISGGIITSAGACVATGGGGGGGSGTVTSIIAGTGLLGGTITTTGTISLNMANANTWTADQTFGNININGRLNVAGTGADVAEEFYTDKNYPAGTVLVMADQGYKSARASDQPYDTSVIGVVSDNPAVVMGKIAGEKKAVVAMVGVIKVKAVAVNGQINKGDLLTTSAVPGYAMKATEGKLGTIIGKALEGLAGERGEIMVLINLQ